MLLTEKEKNQLKNSMKIIENQAMPSDMNLVMSSFYLGMAISQIKDKTELEYFETCFVRIMNAE